MAYLETDSPVNVGSGSNGFDGSSWWIVIILFALIWGGNGWGNNRGYGNGGAGAADNYVLASDFATLQRMLSDGFGDLTAQSRYIQNGICDGFYSMNSSLLNGFNNTNTAIMQNGYETRNAIQGVSSQLADCCCKTQNAIQGVNYNMARNTCDIIQAGNANTQRILDFLSNEKITALQTENVALKGQISQNNQTATILNAVNRTPIPAYVVANPYCCQTYNPYGCTAQSIQ